MNKTFAVIFLLISGLCWSQDQNVKVYAWEEVQTANPDTIYGLSLAKMKLEQLPEKLMTFKNLKVLNLEKNKLTRLPDNFDVFQHLKELNLAKNKLDIFPLPLCRIASIEQLILNRNAFDRLPECVEYISELRYIDLYSTPIDQIPETLINLNHLEKIDFSNVRFSPSFQERWTALLPDVELIFDPPCDCMEK